MEVLGKKLFIFLCVENPVKTINFLAMDCMKDYLRSFIDHIFRGERIFHHNGWPKNCRFFPSLRLLSAIYNQNHITRKWMDRGGKLGNLILSSFELVFFLLNLQKSILVLLEIEKKTFLWTFKILEFESTYLKNTKKKHTQKKKIGPDFPVSHCARFEYFFQKLFDRSNCFYSTASCATRTVMQILGCFVSF